MQAIVYQLRYGSWVAGPVGFGVFKALDDERRKRGGAPRPMQGWFVFVSATIALSWLTALVLVEVLAARTQPLALRLLTGALYYAAVMGWQPVVAARIARALRDRRDEPERVVRIPPLRELAIATAVPIGVAALAMVVARVGGEPLQPTAPVETTGAAALATAGALVVLCAQSLAEEYGWRGAPLTYALERWGTRAGLIVHGIAWGLWYAPLFVLSARTPAESLAPAGSFVLTCMLLGVVLGWLRLRSGSILPPAIANAVLTVVAGLPLLLREGSVGIRDAAFRWPGWPVLAALALAALVTVRAQPRK